MRTFKPKQFIYAKLTELLLHSDSEALNTCMYKLDPSILHFEIRNKQRQKRKRNEK